MAHRGSGKKKRRRLSGSRVQRCYAEGGPDRYTGNAVSWQAREETWSILENLSVVAKRRHNTPMVVYMQRAHIRQQLLRLQALGLKTPCPGTKNRIERELESDVEAWLNGMVRYRVFANARRWRR